MLLFIVLISLFLGCLLYPSAMTQHNKKKSGFARMNGNTKQLLCICLIIFAAFSILKPTRYPTLRNLESMCFQCPEPGLFTLGIAITMLTAGADLSIVAVANLVATINGMLLLNVMPQDAGAGTALLFVLLCFAVAAAVGLLCGCLNGFLVAKLGIFPILATLGTDVYKRQEDDGAQRPRRKAARLHVLHRRRSPVH